MFVSTMQAAVTDYGCSGSSGRPWALTSHGGGSYPSGSRMAHRPGPEARVNARQVPAFVFVRSRFGGAAGGWSVVLRGLSIRGCFWWFVVYFEMAAGGGEFHCFVAKSQIHTVCAAVGVEAVEFE